MDSRNNSKQDKQKEPSPVATVPMAFFSTGASVSTLRSKLVLLGDSGVGKSSLALRFVKKQFFYYQATTIGAAFLTQTVALHDHIRKFEIWDTAGQELYRSLAPMYYRGAAAAIVVYDVTNRQSFLNAKAWVEELKKHACSDIVISLSGNKVDLAENNARQVTMDEAKSYADENNLLFFETSAKSNLNISELFKSIAVKLPIAKPDTIIPDEVFVVDLPGPKKAGCCN